MGNMEQCEGFFRRSRRWDDSCYEIIQHSTSSSGGSVTIPEGCVYDYVLLRVIKGGMCTWKELNDGTYDMKDVWAMSDLLDLHDYIERSSRDKEGK